MRKFYIWLTVVIMTLVFMDVSLGEISSFYLRHNSLKGDYESVDHILKRNDNEILVLGSSVALNSINTKTLQDSMGLKAFNGGGNGQSFPFYLTMLKASIQNHAPQKIILCLQPYNLSGTGLGERYNFLAPYYGMGIGDIDSCLESRQKLDAIFLKSSSYKLNTIWFRILLYNFITPDIKGENGHVAKPIPAFFPTKGNSIISDITPERERELREFIDICKEKGMELTILFTPQYSDIRYADQHKNVICRTMELADKYGIMVYDHTRLEPFYSDSTLFYDNDHINMNGTTIYTDLVIGLLKSQTGESD